MGLQELIVLDLCDVRVAFRNHFGVVGEVALNEPHEYFTLSLIANPIFSLKTHRNDAIFSTFKEFLSSANPLRGRITPLTIQMSLNAFLKS